MVTRYGMAEGLGNRAYAPPRHAFLGEVALPPMRPEVSEATTREIDLAVRDLVEAAARRARDILEARRADYLMPGRNCCWSARRWRPRISQRRSLPGTSRHAAHGHRG